MASEVKYDTTAEADVIEGTARQDAPVLSDGMGCHAGAAEMEAAARAAGSSDILDQYAADYPQ
ncbi:MAG: chlorophyllide reductase subunit Y, partial [Pseudomonadota bacterium]